MRTNDLINVLSADTAAPPAFLRNLNVWIAIAFVAALLLMDVSVGPRRDLSEVSGTWRFLAKFAFAVPVALVFADWVRRLRRPVGPAPSLALLAIPLGLIGVSVVAELLQVPSVLWMKRLVGTNALWCLALVPALSLVPLVLMLKVMTTGATTRPVAAGLACGLLSGAIGAAAYAFHCIDDSPLFVAVWYALGIAIVGMVGALAGGRVLRW